MRMLSALLLACITPASIAQPSAQPQPPAGSNWQRVQELPVGTSVYVTAKASHLTCKLKAVDANTLTCTRGSNPATDSAFQRAEIKSVKIKRRGRSALIGMAIGAGGGAIVGVSLGRNGSFVGRGAGAVIFAIPGALIGLAIGAATGSPASTVYKAP